jgi:hypothetical protein
LQTSQFCQKNNNLPKVIWFVSMKNYSFCSFSAHYPPFLCVNFMSNKKCIIGDYIQNMLIFISFLSILNVFFIGCVQKFLWFFESKSLYLFSFPIQVFLNYLIQMFTSIEYWQNWWKLSIAIVIEPVNPLGIGLGQNPKQNSRCPRESPLFTQIGYQ